VTTRYKNCPKCEYKELNKYKKKCNRQTCMQRVYIQYRNEKCHKSTKVCEYICCCRRRKVTRSYCNRSTGIKYNIIHSLVFNPKLKKCISKSLKVAVRMPCKKPRMIKEKPGKARKYFIKITKITQIISRSTCKCITIRVTIWIRYRCSKRKVTVRKCRGSYHSISEVSVRLNHKKQCIRVRRNRRQLVACNLSIRKRTKKMSRCQFKVYTEYNRVKNCQCKLHRRVHTYYRCCPKTNIQTKCVRNNRIVRITRIRRRSRDRKTCPISVHRKITLIGKLSFLRIHSV